MAVVFMEGFGMLEEVMSTRDDKMLDLISGVLYYLAEQAGGEIIIGELNLKEDARVVIDKDDGLVRVVALPDSVRMGIDLAEQELIAARKAAQAKKDEGVTFTYKTDLSTLKIGSFTDAAQWSSNFTFDEVKNQFVNLSDKKAEE